MELIIELKILFFTNKYFTLFVGNENDSFSFYFFLIFKQKKRKN